MNLNVMRSKWNAANAMQRSSGQLRTLNGNCWRPRHSSRPGADCSTRFLTPETSDHGPALTKTHTSHERMRRQFES